MANVKDLANKPLSAMSFEELGDLQKRAKRELGLGISDSKFLGKAEDLRKALRPEKFGTETVESAKQKLRSNTELATQQKLGIAPIDDISSASSGDAGSFSGFDSSFDSSFGAGTSNNLNIQRVYDEAINTEEVKGIQNEVETKKAALTEALTGINDNPFYSEATRTGRIAKLNEQAGREIRDLEDQLATRKADAQVKVNIALQQYDINDRNYQRNLGKLNLLISSGALLNASSANLSQIAVATGISTNMLQGIKNKMALDQRAPTVSTNTDDAGNVTVSVIDGNTGEIISQTSLGKVDKAAKASSSSSADSADEKQFYTSINEGIKRLEKGDTWGAVWNSIWARYSPDAENEEEKEKLRNLIDISLGVSWRQGGAFERRQNEQDE